MKQTIEIRQLHHSATYDDVARYTGDWLNGERLVKAIETNEHNIDSVTLDDYAVYVKLADDLSMRAALRIVSDFVATKPDEFSSKGTEIRLFWD